MHIFIKWKYVCRYSQILKIVYVVQFIISAWSGSENYLTCPERTCEMNTADN